MCVDIRGHASKILRKNNWFAMTFAEKTKVFFQHRGPGSASINACDVLYITKLSNNYNYYNFIYYQIINKYNYYNLYNSWITQSVNADTPLKKNQENFSDASLCEAALKTKVGS
jgi:hypothetical protein